MKLGFRGFIFGFAFCISALIQAETYVIQYAINDYPGTESDLKGCVNDATELKSVLMDKFSVSDSDIKTYLDSDANVENFIAGWQWVVDHAKAGDQVIFQYSGHGAQLDSTEEPDGKEEVIVLADEKLVSGKFFNEIANDLKTRGIDATLIFDSCFSGGMSRDPYTFNVMGHKLKVENRAMKTMGDVTSRGLGVVAKAKLESLRKRVRSKDATTLGGSFAFLLAASEDKPSADLQFKDDIPSHGAFTYILLAALAENSEMKLDEVMKTIQKILADNKFDQSPTAEYSTEKRSELPLVIKGGN